MTSRNLARHRKAARPLTPLSDATPALRRGLVVAASSGLALTMITSAANAAGGNTQNLERSAGTLSVGPTAEAATLATQNAPIEVDADVVANADTLDVSEVTTEAPGPSEEELAAQAAAEARTCARPSPRACSANSRTRGCERSTPCARGRFTFESPTAIPATTADSPAGRRGMAPRISRARTTESDLPSASRSSPGRSTNHGHDTSTSVSWKT